MSLEIARNHLEKYGLSDRIRLFDVSSATVELAALAVGVEPARIAKTLSFKLSDRAILIACAGDTRIDNPKYRNFFHEKARMLSADEVEQYTNHTIGGVCPFGVPEGTEVYLDISLKRFETVFPAAGTDNSAVTLTPEEFEKASECKAWIDVCKGWE